MILLKKNQIIIYAMALMLVAAGYLNYVGREHDISSTIQVTTTAEEQTKDINIGDAQLVSSNEVYIEEDENNVDTNSSTIENDLEEKQNQTTQTVSNEEINENATNTTNKNINNENTIITSSKTEKNDYFTKSKLERDSMYSQMIETYEKVLNGINSLETQKQSAAEEIKKINDTKNGIMICENLIGTKGFENNVIFVNGKSVSAIIGADELKQEEVSQIQNILERELNASIENIHIAIK